MADTMNDTRTPSEILADAVELAEKTGHSYITVTNQCAERIIELLENEEELGEELGNAVELIRKKDERIKKLLKEQKIGHWVVESKVSWREDYDDAEPVFYAVATCSECGKPYKWEVAKTYVDAKEWEDTYNPNLETLNEKRMPIYNKALEEHKRMLQSVQYDWVSCPYCGAKMEKQP